MEEWNEILMEEDLDSLLHDDEEEEEMFDDSSFDSFLNSMYDF